MSECVMTAFEEVMHLFINPGLQRYLSQPTTEENVDESYRFPPTNSILKTKYLKLVSDEGSC